MAILQIFPVFPDVDFEAVVKHANEQHPPNDFSAVEGKVRYLGTGEVVANTRETKILELGFVLKTNQIHETRWYLIPNKYREVLRLVTATSDTEKWQLSKIVAMATLEQSPELFITALFDTTLHHIEEGQLQELSFWCAAELKRRAGLINSRLNG